MVAEHRGQLSAWLQKKKSGSAMVRVRQYNRRFFTLDFDSRVFFYAHAESSKKVSSVIPFADLVDVRLPESQADKGDTASTCSQTSRVSLFKRLSSGSKLGEEEQQQHSLTLLTKPAKTMELVCSSATEALQWFEAFKAAIADAEGGEGGLPLPLATGSGDESPGSAEVSPKAGDRGPLMPGEGDGQTAPAVAAAVATAAAAAGAAMGAEDATAPPPVKGTFLDFSTDPESPTGTGAPGGAVQNAEAVVTLTGPSTLQAQAFGFEVEGSESSAASSPLPSPRGADLGTPGIGSAGASSGHEMGASPPSGGSRSYEDRHKGLSMQERLASLEFSDEEDEES